MSIVVIVLILVLLVGGGGYYGYSSWGPRGGISLGGVLLLLFLIWIFFGRGWIG